MFTRSITGITRERSTDIFDISALPLNPIIITVSPNVQEFFEKKIIKRVCSPIVIVKGKKNETFILNDNNCAIGL